MFGDNPKRGIINKDPNILAVKNIFKTVQGEGIFAGVPAIFIRLGGCNLACSFCDTDFEDFEEYSISYILDRIIFLRNNELGKSVINLIVITGGEPLRQPIELLCDKLLNLNFTIQIETNGTLYRKLPKEVFIICSPKVSNNKYLEIHPQLIHNTNAIKFLISKSIMPYNQIPNLAIMKYDIPIYIQPMDQYDIKLNKENMKLTFEIAIQTGYRISIQLHKILEIE